MTEKEKKEALLDRANRLPCSPGVYIMKNRAGTVIYVGKSKVLRQRVSQYFQDTQHNIKTERMISAVDTFDYMLCDSEMEALTLENRLIKLHMPKYNIRLKDAKSYPYIKITMQEAYPRLIVTRRRLADGAKYFGPYSGVSSAYAIVRTLQRAFLIPPCKKEFPRDIGRDRPCLYHQMGQCCGLCTGKVSSEEYRERFRDVIGFLRGSYRTVRRNLEENMQFAAENLRFEAAARYRDRIRALEKLWEKQKVVGSPETEQDIFALYTDDLCSCITVFYVRCGAVTDSEHFIFPAEQIIDDSGIASFLCDLYLKREYVPREILTNFSLAEEEMEMLTAFTSERAGGKVTIRRPERGEARALCNMVYENAAQAAAQYQQETEKGNNMLIRLASLLALEVVPQRIEAYDISNFGNDNITAGMITALDGKFRRSDYRIFHIRQQKQDDYAAMREAISRRMQHEEPPLPDLILLDGGRGHVAVIRTLLAQQGIDIPVFGMVKDEYHKTRALTDDSSEISIAREQSVFQFIYQLQEEVHRFTLARMSAAKSKTLRRTSLQNIPGIGPAKARALLRAFGTIAHLREASFQELTAVPSISARNAEAIIEYYKKGQPL